MQYNRFKSYKCDSRWELKLKEGIFKDLEYHPKKLHYTKPETKHTYEPDWAIDLDEGLMPVLRPGAPMILRVHRIVYIEAKGRFRDRVEFTKYIHIRDSLSPNEELVFLFMKPLCPMPNAKKRKDGSIRTHAEWAEKEGFRWFDEKSVLTLLESRDES